MKDSRAYQLRTSFPALSPVIEGFDKRIGVLEVPNYDLAAPDITISPEGANYIDVAVQLKGLDGKPIRDMLAVMCWVTATSGGFGAEFGKNAALNLSTATSDSTGPSTGVLVASLIANSVWIVRTNEQGFFSLSLGNTGAVIRYFHVLWNNRLYAKRLEYV